MKVREIRAAIEGLIDDADVMLDIDDPNASVSNAVNLDNFNIELTGVSVVAGVLVISAEAEEDEDANGDDDDMDDDDDDSDEEWDDEDDDDELDEDDLDAEIEAQRKESLGLN
jgi:hypothetical protein